MMNDAVNFWVTLSVVWVDGFYNRLINQSERVGGLGSEASELQIGRNTMLTLLE